VAKTGEGRRSPTETNAKENKEKLTTDRTKNGHVRTGDTGLFLGVKEGKGERSKKPLPSNK